MPTPTITLPAVSLKPLSLARTAELAARAGFDGIEVLLGPHLDHDAVRAIAHQNELQLSWHEIWSLEDNTSFLNRLMARAGMITTKTELLAQQLPQFLDEPVVCYSHRSEEFHTLGLFEQSHLRLQTSRVQWDQLSWNDFVAVVVEGGFRVTFDTQHVLEWMCDTRGVAALAAYSARELQSILIEGWHQLAPYVKQIHLNNFDPSLGDAFGRNVFPDKGVLNLERFVRHVQVGGHVPVITPEVSPAHLFPLSLPRFTGIPIALPVAARLARLHRTVREMFH